MQRCCSSGLSLAEYSDQVCGNLTAGEKRKWISSLTHNVESGGCTKRLSFNIIQNILF